MWSSRRFYPFPVFGSLLPVANGICNIHTTFRGVTRFSTFFAGPLLKLKKGCAPVPFSQPFSSPDFTAGIGNAAVWASTKPDMKPSFNLIQLKPAPRAIPTGRSKLPLPESIWDGRPGEKRRRTRAQSKTWRTCGAARRTRSVLECASPLALWNAAMAKRLQIAAGVKTLVAPAREHGISRVLVTRAVNVGQNGHDLRGIDPVGQIILRRLRFRRFRHAG